MASSPLVSTEVFASWLGVTFDPGSSEELRAGTVIQTVSGFARSEAKQPDWDITNVPEDVSAIVLMVAVRLWANPDGKTSVTMDDVTRRWERGGIFDENEIRTLRKYRRGSGGLSSIQFVSSSHFASTNGDGVRPVSDGGRVKLYDGLGY